MVVDTRKSIKIEEPVYRRLDNVRGKGETFSQVIERLLSIVEVLRNVPLGPRPESRLADARTIGYDPVEEARLRRADLAGRTLTRED